MNIRVGVDIVEIDEFKKAIKRGGSAFTAKCFVNSELEDRRPQHLAGLFAAKEAVIKALSLPMGSWLDIRIEKDRSGRPKAKILVYENKLDSCDLSISHSTDYAIALFVAVLK